VTPLPSNILPALLLGGKHIPLPPSSTLSHHPSQDNHILLLAYLQPPLPSPPHLGRRAIRVEHRPGVLLRERSVGWPNHSSVPLSARGASFAILPPHDSNSFSRRDAVFLSVRLPSPISESLQASHSLNSMIHFIFMCRSNPPPPHSLFLSFPLVFVCVSVAARSSSSSLSLLSYSNPPKYSQVLRVLQCVPARNGFQTSAYEIDVFRGCFFYVSWCDALSFDPQI
jgi:hypothetical protein